MPYVDLSDEEDRLLASVRAMVGTAAAALTAKPVTQEDMEARWKEGERAGTEKALLWFQGKVNELLEQARAQKYADTRGLEQMLDLVRDQLLVERAGG